MSIRFHQLEISRGNGFIRLRDTDTGQSVRLTYEDAANVAITLAHWATKIREGNQTRTSTASDGRPNLATRIRNCDAATRVPERDLVREIHGYLFQADDPGDQEQ